MQARGITRTDHESQGGLGSASDASRHRGINEARVGSAAARVGLGIMVQ